jgi:hypothetical protein
MGDSSPRQKVLLLGNIDQYVVLGRDGVSPSSC